ncbi:MAG: periplasmic heavy metal sensor [Nitrospira sp.]|nr:MAG: periplasmic heavy metal sensor [Nitrospira sp.]
MMKRQWVVVLGGVACLVAATFLSGLADEAQGRMMHDQMHGGHDQEEQDDHSAHYLKHLLKHAKEIGLTPEQISKVKALQLDFKRSEARLEADAKVAKLELQALMEDEQTDLTAIQAKVDQLKKAEAACLFTAIKSKRTAMALLTPDQREKDRAVHEQMKSGAQHGDGMGGMMGGMGGGGMSGGGHGGSGGGDHAGGAQGGGQHQH